MFQSKISQYKSFIINLVMPAIIFGFITGTLTSFFVTLYKYLAHHIIHFSQIGYELLREHLYILPVLLLLLLGASFLLARVYRYVPNLKGGGIPTSIGILRGIITFKWLSSFVGVFVLSLFSFLVGVPLGNEGPSVQMGTSLGRGSVRLFAKTQGAWDRYSMTGGACAGFSVATGAPISGILFAIEEAHQRISPMIMIVASSSVLFANISAQIFASFFGVSTSLFGEIAVPRLSIKELWIPLVVGLVVGIFGAIILRYYQFLKFFFSKVLRISPQIKIFFILATTVCVGLYSFSAISTGHDLIVELFSPENQFTIAMLVLILVVRTTLTMSANTNGITGGMFVPSLALGVTLSAIIGKIAIYLGMDSELYLVIVVLGIVACMSGLMKTPLIAIIFAIEALSCYENIIAIVMVALISYFVCEVFEAKSINDSAMETRVEELNHGKEFKVVKTDVTIQVGAFASGKQIRDIFWPANLFVLSVKKAKTNSEEVDEHGGKELRAGDVLCVQYSTLDEEATAKELEAIVGVQQKPKIIE
ncbi:MAG: chloride channel protein [Clostridia bacterium]|nr:chloride channel protein [Clostridia bacterium]